MRQTGEERLQESLDTVRRNIDLLAAKAAGNFIDPLHRPKKERKKWTAESYKLALLKRCEWWQDADIPLVYKLRNLDGLKDFVYQALDDQFARYRDVWNMLTHEPVFVDQEFKKESKRIRDLQDGWEWHDKRLRCPSTHLPIHVRKLDGNYIDSKKRGKRNVCQCEICVGLRKRMSRAITEQRQKKAEAKKTKKKKDPKRYD